MKITYIHHSGFLVETEQCYYLFDYEKGNLPEMILVQEAIQEKQLGDIAGKIAADPSKRIIMIAGPSSSGKTTFSQRLSVQLRANGLKPHAIACDNYFVERENTPKDAHGFMDGLSMHYYVVPECWENKGSATDFDEKGWYKTLSKALYIETLINHHTTIMDKYDSEKKIGLILKAKYLK